MSDHEETQVEAQDFEAQVDDNVDDKINLIEVKDDEQSNQGKTHVREPGRSVLPFARVQRIIKADKEIPIVAKEATFLISFATEQFIKQLCQSAHHEAQKDKRSIVYHRDIATVVRRVDEFLFLEEIIPWISTDSEPKKQKPKSSALKPNPTLLDRFMGDQSSDPDVVMNADGTMEAGLEECGKTDLQKVMKIISTFHPSSSVLSSIKCRLTSRDLEHLVIAKLSRLDVYSVRPQELQHECGLDVWGKICSLKALPISVYDARFNVVVLFTHPDPEFLILAYEEDQSGQGRLVVQKQIPLFERPRRMAEFFTDCVVHPSGKLAVVSCYAGKLRIIGLRGGKYVADFDASLPEANVFSIEFLPTEEDQYTIAILFRNWKGRLQLCARDISIDEQELSLHYSFLLQPTIIPEKVVPCPTELPPQLIPVPPIESLEEDSPVGTFLGGVLVVGGREILLFDLASLRSQEKQTGKLKRLEAKKKSNDLAEAARAREKEQERMNRIRKPKGSVEWPWSELRAWTAIDRYGSRFLLGDSFGRLAMLSLDDSSASMILIPLGECSPPTTLTYLTNQVTYVGSHLGDSQLLQISATPISNEKVPSLIIPSDIKTVSMDSLLSMPTKKGKARATGDDMVTDDEHIDNDYSCGRVVSPSGPFITVLESYKNIAPIMDAILVDPDKSGQYQFVTCSGGANTGSLNVIRTGTDFKELGLAPGMEDITRVWSVKIMTNDHYDSHILVSTMESSHLLQVENGSAVKFRRADSGDLNALITNQPTLAFSNVYKRQDRSYADSSLVVQVVPTGVHLLEWDPSIKTYVERAKWDPTDTGTSGPQTKNRQQIVLASTNCSQIALTLGRGSVVLLRIAENRFAIERQCTKELEKEISAMSLFPLNPQQTYSRHISVAYWGSHIVEILDIAANLASIVCSPALPSLVRSVVLYNFGSDSNSKGSDYHPYLLAGLGDGSIATMTFKRGQLADLKTISLGQFPVHLTPCSADGKKAVLAAGNRAIVFFVDNGRLLNSPIMLKGIDAVSPLNTEIFSSSLVLATSAGLFVGRLGELNKMHIHTVPFGLDNPRRIVYEPSLRVYAVSSVRVEPARVGGLEFSSSSFQLVDDTTFAVLGRYKCEPNEEITSLVSFMSRTENQESCFFCLGTYIYSPEETEPSSGRLLIFTAIPNSLKKPNLNLLMLTSAEVNGCVYALSVVGKNLVAAVNSAVLLYRVESLDDGLTPSFTLKKLAEWNHNYMVTSLGSFGDHVVAGDHISSLSLLKITEKEVVLEARDYGPLYPIAVEALDDENLICANDTLNISLFSLNENTRGESLELVGSYHVADMISKILRGSFVSTDKASVLEPKMVFFTSSGRICVLIDVKDEELSLHLTELERNLAHVVSGIGTNHSRFRAPKNLRGTSDADAAAYGFLDGDFLERYLTILDSPGKLKQVVEGSSVFEKLKISQHEIRDVLEQLQRLH